MWPWKVQKWPWFWSEVAVKAWRDLATLNKSRIPYSEGSLPGQHNFLKFKHENIIKMKNKPDPALLRPSNLSNEIKKGYQNLVRLSL
jgi:hypothetical protein